ncbi:hypothetical protein C8035_v011190 [Colletotrichum spinosum]|uniref:Uncharacterized protein n=2 Tax=Colletotrichum orbiculare species complex TaxID=2707354 RepID=A0A4V3HQK0_COLTR|nr:hypothetical protein CTRI78_v012130 [Colletotrichum trifolii]TDZ33696.1 hypothetical protein C8035_v011190 [Colletotrichum spinosum]
MQYGGVILSQLMVVGSRPRKAEGTNIMTRLLIEADCLAVAFAPEVVRRVSP